MTNERGSEAHVCLERTGPPTRRVINSRKREA